MSSLTWKLSSFLLSSSSRLAYSPLSSPSATVYIPIPHSLRVPGKLSNFRGRFTVIRASESENKSSPNGGDSKAPNGTLPKSRREILLEYVQNVQPEFMELFVKRAPQQVVDAMRQTVTNMIGTLPSQFFAVTVTTVAENLAQLMYSVLMTGYMFRNAQTRLELQQSLEQVALPELQEKKDVPDGSKKFAASTSSIASRLLLSLFCLCFLFLCLSFFRRTAPPSFTYSAVTEKSNGNCNYSDGRWIYDSTIRSAQRYDHTCKEIFKGWNCIASHKLNAIDILRWRWKPYGCDLPPFDPSRFLDNYRDTNIGFVGDSLNRNMFVSLFCALKRVSSEVKKWRPVGADRGFTFVKYNLTIAYHRTNLLARNGRWSATNNKGTLESLGYKEGYRVDVDLPEGTWIEAPNFHDILIFNTGHWWWAPSKFDPVKSPMLFFEKGVPVTPTIAPDAGLDLVLRRMVSFVEKNAKPGAILFFRTQSPRHFEGGDWDQGGSCPRLRPLAPQEVDELFSTKNNGTNVETRLVNQHLYRALKGSKFQILDITHMSEYRADAHPSTAGGKRHDDCMHWCLPGLTDTWNDLFIAHLNRIRIRN